MRLLEILFYLLRNNKSTTKELSEYFNVSRKTIQRDIDKLTILGIPIITRRGGNGGIELDKNYIIHKGLMTEDDYKTLLLSLYIFGNIFKNKDICSVIEKILMVECEKVTKNLEQIKSTLIIDLGNYKFDLTNKVYNKIDKAIEANNFVEISLVEKKYEVLPISYVLKETGIFLYCYDKEYMLVKINKILESKILNRTTNEKIIEYKDNKDNIKILI
ncbi:MAG: HTH domain-containing protein [Clostridium sp.]|uniref:helix-turn-helix transcriptional regulator n=1 Tax=Clostridium sp. TaxID=1506 RepID=UPI002906DFA3|nr:HTH domain-containing protein [Clostridium sp.]MDU4938664.1 HTH domain-containing protein [Clostridium sp.]